MNGKEMIEEMARLIRLPIENWLEDTGAIPQATTYYAELMGSINDSAEVLFNEGYRKIPKDAVVIKEEYYFRLCEMANCAPLDRPLIDKRKETAKEILQELWHSKLETTIAVSSKHNKEDIKIACLAVVDLIRDKIQEIAKQYGVEIKE